MKAKRFLRGGRYFSVATDEYPGREAIYKVVDRASVELAPSDEISGTRVNIPTCSITLPALTLAADTE